MNIFKILASGDGSIKEPNVSSFFGYLLNPKADHSINDELLKKILYCLYEKNKESSLKEFLVDQYKNPRNLSTRSNFEIEVLLEQAFKVPDSPKKIVDIVILCYEKQKDKKETLAQSVLANYRNTDNLKQIILLEIKIRDDANKEGQLIDQCSATISTLSDILPEEKEIIKKTIINIYYTLWRKINKTV